MKLNITFTMSAHTSPVLAASNAINSMTRTIAAKEVKIVEKRAAKAAKLLVVVTRCDAENKPWSKIADTWSTMGEVTTLDSEMEKLRKELEEDNQELIRRKAVKAQALRQQERQMQTKAAESEFADNLRKRQREHDANEMDERVK